MSVEIAFNKAFKLFEDLISNSLFVRIRIRTPCTMSLSQDGIMSVMLTEQRNNSLTGAPRNDTALWQMRHCPCPTDTVCFLSSNDWWILLPLTVNQQRVIYDYSLMCNTKCTSWLSR